MKYFMKKIALLVVMIMMTFMAVSAQEPSQVEKMFDELVKKYENIEGVECMYVAKGSGLALVKMMLNQELGKSFMKGVTSITIIDYSNASQETCMLLHKEIDMFSSVLEEFNLNEDESLSDDDYIRSFASASDSGSVSDFVFVSENEDSKMIMYMASEI